MLLVSQRVEAPRMEPHIPLQGSIKRKLEDDSSPASSGVPDVIFPNESKRLCLDDVNLAMGQGANPNVACPEMQSSPFSTSHSASSLGVAGHPVLLENNHMNGGGIGSPFSVPPNAEINQKGSIGGQNNSIVHYDEKGNSLQSVDQELQDLLEELTKMPDPSPNDLDLEKILCSKAEEPLGLSHSQPSISTTPKSSPQTSHLENHVANKDFSPGCNPTSGGSPQMRPSSAGANFQVPPSNKPAASPISTAAQSKNQPPPMLPVPLPNIPGSNWHAQQLKQLAASKQVSTTKQQVQAPSWPTMSPPGLSPPYRAGSSPHHQPFSPQNVMVSGMPANNLPGNNIQSPQNSLLSSMTSSSTPSNGPSPPYGSEKLSSPALNQQPFSPQSSMLPTLTAASLPANNIKSPQNNLVASMASTNTGPSPPYRPEKLSSPALHQQPFSPQGTLISNITPTSNPTSMQSSLFKSMTTNQSKNMNIIMQQPSSSLQPGLVSESPVSQDQFSFNNTKPLSHFASESATQKMSPLTAGQGQQTLIHYLQQQQQQQQQSPATQQSQQPNNSQFLQQQFRQLIQPHRMQRHMQPATLPSQSRQDQNAGIVARLQEPGSIPSGGSVPAPATVNGYTMRNHLLKQQIMKRQLMQEKQRQNMLGVTSEQRSLFATQQINQFQGVQQPVPADCSQVMPAPPPNHRMLPSNPAMLQSTLGSGVAPATASQSSGTMVMIPHNPGKQQGIFPPNSDFNMPLRPSQNSLGMNSGCQTVHSHSAVRPGMPMAGFSSGSLANHSATQQHLRQPSMPRIPNVYPNSSAQMWTPTAVPRMPSQSQMDTSMQQFSGNTLFSKQNARPSAPGQQFSQPAVVPPNQIAPGVQVRQMQKLSMGQSGQGLSSMSNQNLRHNLTRGPLPAMNVMKSVPQGVSSFNQLNPAPGLGPPSYPSTGQTPDAFGRMSATAAELPQYDFVSQHSNAIMPANCSDTDFLDSLMKNSGSNDEEWLNNLTMIDDILGQHAQSSGHV
ncbi:mastermind-like domain-containing protein 1 [Pluvialis apricaria]